MFLAEFLISVWPATNFARPAFAASTRAFAAFPRAFAAFPGAFAAFPSVFAASPRAFAPSPRDSGVSPADFKASSRAFGGSPADFGPASRCLHASGHAGRAATIEGRQVLMLPLGRRSRVEPQDVDCSGTIQDRTNASRASLEINCKPLTRPQAND